MGYLERIEITPTGVTVTPFDEVSFADKVELDLILKTDPNAIKIVCWNCFAPIEKGTGNSCFNHKDLKGSVYYG